MSCGDDEKLGCDGGSAYKAWEFTMGKGIVTGGPYDSNEVPIIYYTQRITNTTLVLY